jgi:hypothetical protein
MPFTLQLTAVFEVPVTVAVNCCVFPKSTLELLDETETVTDCGGGVVEDGPPPQDIIAIEMASKKTCITRPAKPL